MSSPPGSLPVFVYVIVRGHKMAEHEAADVRATDAAVRAYIRDAVGPSTGLVNELERLADLKAKGVIDDAEFAQLKAKLVG